MITCSFTIHFKKFNVCSKVFVECIICFGQLEGVTSSSFSSAPLTPKASTNSKKLNVELALRVSSTLTHWAPKTLNIMVALISYCKEL